MQATIFRRTLSTVLALDMENTTLLDSRYALRDEMRHWLVHSVYREEIEDLQTRIDRDLSHWLDA